MIKDRQLLSDIQSFLTSDSWCPRIDSSNLESWQASVSFLAEICSVLSNDAKDRLIRLQEAVYEATVRHYESQQLVVTEKE